MAKLTDAEKVDDAKTALPATFKVQTEDQVPVDVTYEDLDEAKDAVMAALTEMVTGAGAEIDAANAGDDDGTADGFKWAETTAFAAGTITAESGTAGAYTVTVYVKSGNVSDSKDVTVTVPAKAFKDTTAGQAAQAIMTALAAVDVTPTEVAWAVGNDSRDAAATATAIATGLITDVTTAINSTEGKDNVTITAVAATAQDVTEGTDLYTAPKATGDGGTDGSIWMKITYAYKDGANTSATVLAYQVVEVTLAGET